MAKKLTKRKAFNFLRSYYDVLNELNDDKDKLDYLLAIIDKQFLDANPEGLGFLSNLCYESQRHAIESSVNGWKRANKSDLLGNTITTPPTTPPTTIMTNHKTPTKEEKEKEKEKEQYSDFDLAFKDFEKMRKLIKKPLTDRASKAILTKLNSFSDDTEIQIQILEQSIVNNWQTVYPLKNSNKKEGENGILIKDLDIDVNPIKDLKDSKYRFVIMAHSFFQKRAEHINRQSELELLEKSDLGVWINDTNQIEKEYEFDPYELFSIFIYLNKILYDSTLHFDTDSISSLKDLYGNYGNGKNKYLRVSKDAKKYIDRYDIWSEVRTLSDKINGKS